jgi:hypothetical protein
LAARDRPPCAVGLRRLNGARSGHITVRHIFRSGWLS